MYLSPTSKLGYLSFKSSLSPSVSSQASSTHTSISSTSLPKQNHIQRVQTTSVESHVTDSPKSPVRPGDRSPNRGLRVLLLVRGFSWRNSTQKIAFLFWRIKSLWSVGHYHLPLLSHA